MGFQKTPEHEHGAPPTTPLSNQRPRRVSGLKSRVSAPGKAMKIREKTSIDVLKEIFCLKWDKQLAPILGCTTQAVSCARQRDRLSARMLEQAAKKCGMTRQQLKDFLPAQSRAVEDMPKQELREEFRRCRQEIWQLKEENRRLIEENGKLRLGA